MCRLAEEFYGETSATALASLRDGSRSRAGSSEEVVTSLPSLSGPCIREQLFVLLRFPLRGTVSAAELRATSQAHRWPGIITKAQRECEGKILATQSHLEGKLVVAQTALEKDLRSANAMAARIRWVVDEAGIVHLSLKLSLSLSISHSFSPNNNPCTSYHCSGIADL